jgi:rhomboid-related protein 1/2/3
MVLSHPQNKLSKSILGHLRTKTLRWIAPKKYVEDELYISQFNCLPPPWFIPLVSLVIIGVFIWYAVELAKAGTPVTWLTGVPTYSPLIYCPSRRYEAWRFITYAFMHSGYQHIVMNLILQIIIGVPLEWVHKWRVIPIYIGGIIAGSLGQSVCDTGVALVGASGGVYALIGAHFGNIFMVRLLLELCATRPIPNIRTR